MKATHRAGRPDKRECPWRNSEPEMIVKRQSQHHAGCSYSCKYFLYSSRKLYGHLKYQLNHDRQLISDCIIALRYPEIYKMIFLLRPKQNKFVIKVLIQTKNHKNPPDHARRLSPLYNSLSPLHNSLSPLHNRLSPLQRDTTSRSRF